MLWAASLALPAISRADVPPSLPSIDPWRYTEDYRYLDDPANRTGAWGERGKWIRLGNGAGLTLGAEVRARYEHYRNNEFGAAAVPDEGYALYRFLPYADLRAGRHFRAFTQLILTQTNRDGASIGPPDDTGNDVLQAFADVSLAGAAGEWTLRGGRQVMAYGSERLISARYGPNVLRAFDGGMASWQASALRVDAFLVRPVRNDRGNFQDRADRDRRLGGFHATWFQPGGHPDTGLDTYLLNLSSKDARYNQGSGPENRNTAGLRYFGERGRWDWDLEGAYQYGGFAGAPVRAWSLASHVGYTFADAPLRPRLSLKANVISGDRDPDDASLQTFNVLFPQGKYFGEAGQLGPSNLINLHPALTLDLGSGWSLGAAAVFYWRQSLQDGVYGVAGNLLRPAGGSRSRYIGTQADVVLGWTVSRHLSVEAAYSVFRPSSFIRDTGRADVLHFVGLEALWRY
ncbi:alginate export family protein [Achromobacter marplatensis]|uniref:alginate export family protein n=1 Tax=Achromobacter marplatensis TaxID=470868 RepID=UPI0039F6D470